MAVIKLILCGVLADEVKKLSITFYNFLEREGIPLSLV